MQLIYKLSSSNEATAFCRIVNTDRHSSTNSSISNFTQNVVYVLDVNRMGELHMSEFVICPNRIL